MDNTPEEEDEDDTQQCTSFASGQTHCWTHDELTVAVHRFHQRMAAILKPRP